MVFIPSIVGPRLDTGGNNAARWYSGGVCAPPQNLVIGPRFDDYIPIYSAVRIAGIGTTTSAFRAGASTLCTALSGYFVDWGLYSYPSVFGVIGLEIDIWKAYRDGVWSGSIALTVESVTNQTYNSLFAYRLYNAYRDLTALAGNTYSGLSSGSVACGFTATLTKTITVYDTGVVTAT